MVVVVVVSIYLSMVSLPVWAHTCVLVLVVDVYGVDCTHRAGCAVPGRLDQDESIRILLRHCYPIRKYV